MGSSNCLEFSDLAEGESVWAPKLRDMLSWWDSRPPKATQTAARAKQNQATRKNGQPAAVSSSEKHESSQHVPEAKDDPPVKADPSISSGGDETLPTPNPSSSLAQGVEPQEPKESNSGENNDRGIVETIESTDVPEPASVPVHPREVDEQTWNGFDDTPAALKP